MKPFSWIGLLPALLLVGCAGSPCRPPANDPGLLPSVAASGDYLGRSVEWGGLLVATRNLADRTELEVVGYPLDRCGRPQIGGRPVGRFILVRPGYLDPTEFQPGRQVTAAGTIVGVSEGRVGEAPYRFPRLESANPYLWPGQGRGGPDLWPTLGIGIGTGGIGVGGGIGISF
jgi:outer membrane lipoprotein